MLCIENFYFYTKWITQRLFILLANTNTVLKKLKNINNFVVFRFILNSQLIKTFKLLKRIL